MTGLEDKFRKLGQTPEVHRLMVDIDLLDLQGNTVISIDAILDTGATISLLPIAYLKRLPVSPTIRHTVWGIVGDPDCRIEAELKVVDIHLKDPDGNVSPVLAVPVAFALSDDCPHLLGMKGLIENSKICVDLKEKKVSIVF